MGIDVSCFWCVPCMSCCIFPSTSPTTILSVTRSVRFRCGHRLHFGLSNRWPTCCNWFKPLSNLPRINKSLSDLSAWCKLISKNKMAWAATRVVKEPSVKTPPRTSFLWAAHPRMKENLMGFPFWRIANPVSTSSQNVRLAGLALNQWETKKRNKICFQKGWY